VVEFLVSCIVLVLVSNVLELGLRVLVLNPKVLVLESGVLEASLIGTKLLTSRNP